MQPRALRSRDVILAIWLSTGEEMLDIGPWGAVSEDPRSQLSWYTPILDSRAHGVLGSLDGPKNKAYTLLHPKPPMRPKP